MADEELLKKINDLLERNYYSLHMTVFTPGERIAPNKKYIVSLSKEILAKMQKSRPDREKIAKWLYYIRSCSYEYPAGREWGKCRNQNLWLRNADRILALFEEVNDE